MTENATAARAHDSCATIDAGICGFSCRIRARRIEARRVALQIGDTECRQIRQMAEKLDSLSLQDLFAPFARNPVYLAAQQAGCHASCAVPAAVLKTAEVAMEMALPRAVCIRFEDCAETKDESK